MNKEKKEELIREVKFVCFSASAGAIQLGSDILMVEVFHFAKWLSYLIALILSVIWNFTLNRKFTFKSANNIPVAMLKVVGYYAVFTPLSTAWTYLFVDKMGLNNYLILFITMVINMLTEYVFQKFFVFNEKKAKPLDNSVNEI